MATDRERYREKCEYERELVGKAKATYYIDNIEECSGEQNKLFQIVDKLLGCSKDACLATSICKCKNFGTDFP